MPHRSVIRHLVTLLCFVGLFIALSLPNRLVWIAPPAFLFFPLELLVIGFLLLIPGVVGKAVHGLLAALLGLGLLLRGADLVTHEIFARRFNPVFDSHLLADASRLLSGVLGSLASILVALGLVLVVALVCWLAYVMLGRIQRTLQSAPRLAGVALLALLLVWGGLKTAGWSRADTFAWDQLAAHGRDTLHSLQDLQKFAATVGDDAAAELPTDGLLSRLAGKDVYIVFAESYGRVLLEQDPFKDSITEKLNWAEETLAADGLQMRSAFLTSPTVGGLSWLAHGTLLSGAWIDSENRYNSLMLSERLTLNRLFRKAGWRTVAGMPAISLAWPEGAYYGYDQIYNAHNFGYQGLPFNWVTMPDQYVWSALQARERSEQNRPPVMAELALISSHAPWTPNTHLVPWDQVGDGSIFNDQAQAGPSPEEVWSDVNSIRQYYRQSIEYMLETLVSYLQAYGDDDLVVLILGDHQAAPMITGDADNRDVPVHLIARDPAVIEAIESWHWQPGMLPDTSAPVWRMDEVRDRFVETFSKSDKETN